MKWMRFIQALIFALMLFASDDLIYDQVRLKLVSDTTVQGGAIEVEVKDGAVTLRGKVRTEKAKEKATKLTKSVKGVRSVDNKLVVSPTGL
jgi:hyperosmotically inducible protein